MDFYDYTFDDPATLLCDSVFTSTTGHHVELEIKGLEPKSFINMIRGWDIDAIEELIEELRVAVKDLKYLDDLLKESDEN